MKKLSLLGMLFLALFGCRNDIDEIIPGVTTTAPPIIISGEYNPESDLVTGTIFGRVYDEQENPIVNAQVKYDGKNYTTDEEGRFFIIDEVLDKNGTFFTVEADGYFKGSRRLNPQDGSVNYAYVQLLELSTIGTFNATEGGQVASDSLAQIRIDFPPNSVISENGNLYNGEVTVAAKYLDPTAPNIGEIMPGNLLGLNNQVEEVSLVSYGMMAVELFGENGEKLNIAEGETATLSFPIPAEILSSAPDEILLWSFEEEQYGIWAEEGVATLQNGRYVGEVSHFSFWNCDAPFDLVCIEGQIISSNGRPLINTKINISVNQSSITSCGITDNRGIFAGKLPKGEELILAIGQPGQASCEIRTINIGPFEMDGNIGQIQLEEASTFTINGIVVDCNNAPLQNGLIRVRTSNNTVEFLTTKEGTFDFSILNCDNANEVSIKAIHLDSLVESNSITLPVTPIVEFGTIVACDNQFSEFFELTVNGRSSIVSTGLNLKYEPDASFTGLTIDIRADTTLTDEIKFEFIFMSEVQMDNTYELEGATLFNLRTFKDFFDENLILSCVSECQEVENFILIVNENGGIGGHLGGEFSGQAIFNNLDDNTEPSYPFSGNFRLPIQ